MFPGLSAQFGLVSTTEAVYPGLPLILTIAVSEWGGQAPSVTLTVYSPAHKPVSVSLVEPLLQRKVYGSIPQFTFTVAVPLQAEHEVGEPEAEEINFGGLGFISWVTYPFPHAYNAVPWPN